MRVVDLNPRLWTEGMIKDGMSLLWYGSSKSH